MIEQGECSFCDEEETEECGFCEQLFPSDELHDSDAYGGPPICENCRASRRAAYEASSDYRHRAL
jgi:hypothetical protein